MTQAACPRCGGPRDLGALECAYCGVVFAKLSRRTSAEIEEPDYEGELEEPPRAARPARSRRPADPPAGAAEDSGPLARLAAALLYVEPGANSLIVALRAALLAGLALWSIFFFRHAMDLELAASFMHLIHLPFHEGGHVVFMPFGDLLTSLGGSLMQFLVPLVCAGALLRRRDTFGAAVCAWWAGQSLMDVAPYIADARALELVLIGGKTGAEVEGHDWEAILTTLGWINHDIAIGRAVNAAGVALMLLALAWGAYVVAGQYRQRERFAAP